MPNYYTKERMNELRELSVSSFGILKKNSGFTGSKHKSLIIGLGGMGRDTVDSLKENIIKRIGEIQPEYIQFRVFDTDTSDRQKFVEADSGKFTETEFPRFDNRTISATLARNDMLPKAFKALVPEGFNLCLAADGCNQVRLAGGLTVMDSEIFRTIYNSIKLAITELGNFTDTSLDVHIIAGSGGGCGSGLVIHIPYIVREIVRDMRLGMRLLNVQGHVYLPNAYRGEAVNEAIIYRNGYALLKELDYYMNIHMIGETFDCLYPDPVGQIRSDKPIFDRCTLIGGYMAPDIVDPTPKKSAIHTTIENLITNVIGRNDANGVDDNISTVMSSNSFTANEMQSLQYVLVPGRNGNFPPYGNYHYDVIGSSRITFPTSLVINKFMGLITSSACEVLKNNAQKVSEEAVEEFEGKIGILPSKIFADFEEVIKTRLQVFLARSDISWTVEAIENNTIFQDLDHEIDEAIAEFDADNQFVNLAIARANSACKEIFTDYKRGPYYLAELISRSPSNANGLNGMLSRIGKYFESVIMKKAGFSDTEISKLKQSIIQGEDRVVRSYPFVGKRVVASELPAYKNRLIELYKVLYMKKLCDKLLANYYLETDAGSVIRRVTDSLRRYLALTDVFEEINSIIKDNGKIAGIKIDNLSDDPTSIFAIQDRELGSLKTAILNKADAEFVKYSSNGEPEQYITAFTNAMLTDTYGSWLLDARPPVYGNSNVCAAYRSFLESYRGFENLLKISMVDFLNDAYSNDTPEMKQSVISIMLGRISHNAHPRYDVWDVPAFDWADVESLCYTYMVLPSSFRDGNVDGLVDNGWQTMFTNAFNNLTVNYNRMGTNTYWSPDCDTIYAFKMYVKMPLFIHSSIVDYEKKYWSDSKASGLHYCEAPGSIDLRKYPSLIPESQYYRTANGNFSYSDEPESEYEKKYNRQIAEVFETAKKFGIVFKDDNDIYKIKLIRADKKIPGSAIEAYVNAYLQANDISELNLGEFKLNMADEIRRQCSAGISDVILVKDIIAARQSFVPNCDENAIILLRKQMKLLSLLEEEVDYFSKTVGVTVDEVDKRLKYNKHMRLFADLMVRSIICEERGVMWNYNFEGIRIPVLIKANYPRMATGEENIKLKYVEMEICKLLYNDVRFENEHRAALEAKMIESRNLIILCDDPAKANSERAVVESGCAALIQRCNSVLSSLVGVFQIEAEARVFYNDLIKSVNQILGDIGFERME